jgi:hypothetical protein
VISDPDRPTPEIPSGAVACSQAQVARALGCSEYGGLVKDLKDQGILTFADRIAGRLYIVARNPADHNKLRSLVLEEKQNRRRKPKRPPDSLE